jgi:hypothetical protein
VALSQEYTHNQLTKIRESLSALGAKDVRWLNLSSKEEKQSMEAAKDTAASAASLFERYVEADKNGTENLDVSLLLKFNSAIVADGDRKYSEQATEC